MGVAFGQPYKEPDVVLVPPIFERDIRGRSRMAKSSYEYLFCKPGLRWLMCDYMLPRACVNFRASEDISWKLRLGSSEMGDNSFGSFAIRKQRSGVDPFTFVDMKVQKMAAGDVVKVRGCLFDPGTGLGMFGVGTLTPGNPEVRQLGLRYSSPSRSAGIILHPGSDTISHLWVVGRHGAVTLGAQILPNLNLRELLPNKIPASLWEDMAARSSFAFAYSPPAAFASGSFTAAIEVQPQKQLLVSFLQHMAVQRRVKNPFEDENVAGIVNYINIGIQVATPLSQSSVTQPPTGGWPSGTSAVSAPGTEMNAAASWQANKNMLVKARVGTEGVAAALAFKAWWQPSFVVAATAAWKYSDQIPRFGASFALENWGNLRYERSSGQLLGGALVQRHVASPEDIMNKEGKGILVQKEDFDNPEILGQIPSPTAQYL